MKTDVTKIKIEQGIPVQGRSPFGPKYLKLYEAAAKMKDGDSVLLKDYYHASALNSYLRSLHFKAPIRIIRDAKGQRLGWRVWALKQERVK